MQQHHTAKSPRVALTVVSALVPSSCLAAGLAFVDLVQDGVAGADGLRFVEDVAVAPGGAHAYAAASGEHAIGVFSRDAGTGRLSFVQVVRDNVGGVDGLQQLSSVVVSPDGLHVYATGEGEVAVFDRDGITGQLSFTQVAQQGTQNGERVALSPDGKNVYLSGGDTVAVFSRNAVTGHLTFVEVQQDGVNGVDGIDGAEWLEVSPDGAHVYVAGALDFAVAVFSRDAMTGALTFVEMQQQGVGGVDGLTGVTSVTVSPDGGHVYTAALGNDAVAVFGRNASTGELTFVEVERNGIGGVSGLSAANAVAVSPDGNDVYVAGAGSWAVVRFSRNTSTGEITFEDVRRDGVAGSDGLQGAFSVTVSPDGKHIYVSGTEESAVSLFRPLTVECSATPATGCQQPTVVQKALIDIRPAVSPGNRLLWKWAPGQATTTADFGDPVTTPTDYTLCLYDQSGAPQPLLGAVAPTLTFCKEQLCWKAKLDGGFSYKASKSRTPDGLTRVALTPGLDAEARVRVRGKGENLSLPTLPLTLPVTVQLQAANGECWEALYDTALVNDATRFMALAN